MKKDQGQAQHGPCGTHRVAGGKERWSWVSNFAEGAVFAEVASTCVTTFVVFAERVFVLGSPVCLMKPLLGGLDGDVNCCTWFL